MTMITTSSPHAWRGSRENQDLAFVNALVCMLDMLPDALTRSNTPFRSTDIDISIQEMRSRTHLPLSHNLMEGAELIYEDSEYNIIS